MKRLFVFIMAFCMLLSMAACGTNTPAEEPTVPVTEPPASEGLAFNVYDTYCEVSGIGTCVDKDIVIPSTYNGIPVTRIADKAFEFCSSLNSVTIQNGVIGIGDSAFLGCPILTSVTIPDSVTDIGRSAFEECVFLTEIVIPDSVTSISNGLFDDCVNLTSVKIPDGVTSIGDFAFSDCPKLTDIAIPDSVTSIGGDAFHNCNSLKYNIVDDAYYFGTSNNPFWVLVKARYTITSCDIHTDTKIISGAAFQYCSQLTSISIPTGVAFIGGDAFSSCDTLTSITYEGTTEQWGNIAVDTYWNYRTPATEVICTDGAVSLN